MSYLVLARKYRPKSFDDLIGQDHITGLLKKAIDQDRVSHAYLFTGPRGVGKTSCARILAKCLNNDKGPSSQPDVESSLSREIAEGRSFDVLEIDGASNRGIDEVRSLREGVRFAPTYGRYKIYIVDEVHMLTSEAFNALLKTLEEPPAHVIFIFATTEPQKVPATILSRCQRYDFKRIPLPTISETLTEICKAEKLKIDADAVYAIAKAAQGSMRDALSILDQLSALSERKIAAEDVYSMLGLVELDLLFALADALARKDCARALSVTEEIVEKGKDLKQLLKDLTEHYRHLMIIKVGGKALSRLVDYPAAVKERLLEQTQQLTLKDIVQSIDTFVKTQDVIRITEFQRMPLELAFARLTYQDDLSGPPANEAPPSEPAKRNFASDPKKVLSSKKGEVNIDGYPSPPKKEPPVKQEPVSHPVEDINKERLTEAVDEAFQSSDVTLDQIRRAWDALTFAVSRKKMSVATFLQEGVPVEFIAPKLTVGFTKECSFQKESLESSENTQLIENVFADKLCTPIVLRFETVEEYQPNDHEPDVDNALKMFHGKVVKQWHQE